MWQLKNSKCNRTQNPKYNRTQNPKCYKADKKLKMWQNSKTHNLTKLKKIINWQNQKNQNMTKFNMSQKNLIFTKLKMWHNKKNSK